MLKGDLSRSGYYVGGKQVGSKHLGVKEAPTSTCLRNKCPESPAEVAQLVILTLTSSKQKLTCQLNWKGEKAEGLGHKHLFPPPVRSLTSGLAWAVLITQSAVQLRTFLPARSWERSTSHAPANGHKASTPRQARMQAVADDTQKVRVRPLELRLWEAGAKRGALASSQVCVSLISTVPRQRNPPHKTGHFLGI